jgi:AraC-like DNA-binding protein
MRKENRILGILFMMMAAYSLLLSLYNIAMIDNNYKLLALYIPIDYIILTLIGPFIYLYINVLLNRSYVVKSWVTLFHLIPVLPSAIFMIWFPGHSEIERVAILKLNFNQGIWQLTALNSIFYIQMTIYLILSYRIIISQMKLTSKVTKGSIQIDISWLKTLMIIDLIIMFASAPLYFYFENEKTSNIIGQLAVDIQLIYIFIKSVWQTGVFPEETIMDTSKSKETFLKISDDIADDYLKALIAYMNDKRPYLQEDCNIQNIAEMTGISVHHLSNILNNRFEKNFSDFINAYRIEEAKRILSSDLFSKMTLEAIGYECGFGSKSCFNKAFKKRTNLTPSEYRNQTKLSN